MNRFFGGPSNKPWPGPCRPPSTRFLRGLLAPPPAEEPSAPSVPVPIGASQATPAGPAASPPCAAGSPVPGSAAPAPAAPPAAADLAGPLATIAALPPERGAEAVPLLQALFQKRDQPPAEWAAALHQAQRLGIAAYCQEARQALRRSDETLVVEALTYLARFDADWLFANIGTLLRQASVAVKRGAIQVVGATDSMAAASMVLAMVRDDKLLADGLACATEIDFEVLREPLADRLLTAVDAAAREEGLCLFPGQPRP
jgi:hypothetical protein